MASPSQPSASGQASAISYRTSLRAIGEPEQMIVPDEYRKSVGYVIEERWSKEEKDYVKHPVGTVFFVRGNLPTTDMNIGGACYAVTCKHVVFDYDGEPPEKRHLRVNLKGGGFDDLLWEDNQWTLNDASDVAVAPITLGPKYDVTPYRLPLYDTGISFPPLQAGHDIFGIGLFQPIPGDDSVSALVRSGTVALPNTNVKVNVTESMLIDLKGAHLIEARSWGGESGSPVFAYTQEYQVEESFLEQFDSALYSSGFGGPRVRADLVPMFIGILQGHFILSEDVTNKRTSRKSQKTIGTVPVNYGIGIVIPKEQIVGTLKSDNLEAERRNTAETRVRRKAPSLQKIRRSSK